MDKIKKGKIYSTVATTVLLFLGIVVGVLLSTKHNQQNQKNIQPIEEKAAGTTIVSVFPKTQNLTKNQNFSFSIRADTGKNQITAVDIKLKFDPLVVEINSLEMGSDLVDLDNTIENSIDNDVGEISFVVFTLDKTKAVSGESIEILKINAKVKNTASLGTHSVTIDPSSAMAAVGESQNVLVDSLNAELIVKEK